jgi:hypothetical protein
MANPLDFSLIANNDSLITLTIRRKNKTLVDLTGFTIEWGMFLNGIEVLSKTTVAAGGITIPDQTIDANLGICTLAIDAADTLALETEIKYIHEFAFTDPSVKSSNPSKGDETEKAGEVYLRRQYKAQS